MQITIKKYKVELFPNNFEQFKKSLRAYDQLASIYPIGNTKNKYIVLSNLKEKDLNFLSVKNIKLEPNESIDGLSAGNVLSKISDINRVYLDSNGYDFPPGRPFKVLLVESDNLTNIGSCGGIHTFKDITPHLKLYLKLQPPRDFEVSTSKENSKYKIINVCLESAKFLDLINLIVEKI